MKAAILRRSDGVWSNDFLMRLLAIKIVNPRRVSGQNLSRALHRILALG